MEMPLLGCFLFFFYTLSLSFFLSASLFHFLPLSGESASPWTDSASGPVPVCMHMCVYLHIDAYVACRVVCQSVRAGKLRTGDTQK